MMMYVTVKYVLESVATLYLLPENLYVQLKLIFNFFDNNFLCVEIIRFLYLFLLQQGTML